MFPLNQPAAVGEDAQALKCVLQKAQQCDLSWYFIALGSASPPTTTAAPLQHTWAY